MISKRQRIVDALIDRMSLIRYVNGYLTNIGENVFDWEIHFQQEDIGEDGAISICDMPAETADSGVKSNPRSVIWKMPVQLRCFFGKNTEPAVVRKAIADINRALALDDRLKDEDGIGLAMLVRPLREGISKSEDSFELIAGIVEIEVQYITEKFNPDN